MTCYRSTEWPKKVKPQSNINIIIDRNNYESKWRFWKHVILPKTIHSVSLYFVPLLKYNRCSKRPWTLRTLQWEWKRPKLMKLQQQWLTHRWKLPRMSVTTFYCRSKFLTPLFAVQCCNWWSLGLNHSNKFYRSFLLMYWQSLLTIAFVEIPSKFSCFRPLFTTMQFDCTLVFVKHLHFVSLFCKQMTPV